MAIIKNIENFDTAVKTCYNLIETLENTSDRSKFEAFCHEAARSRQDVLETLDFILLIRKLLNMSSDSFHTLHNKMLANYEAIDVISRNGHNKGIHLLPESYHNDLLDALKTNDIEKAQDIAKLAINLKFNQSED